MKRIIYTQDNGILSVLIPSPKAATFDIVEVKDNVVTDVLDNNGEPIIKEVISEQKMPRLRTIEEIAEKDVPAGLDYEIVDTSKIPTDRTFRGAWEKGTDSKPVKVNMDKARSIHMGRIRGVRNKELARLDIEQLKGNDVAAQKQALRDITSTFDLTVAATPDELKNLWPNELKTDAFIN